MKYILVIGDGMADDPIDKLGGKTPLEYAKTPAMDALASAGALGSVLTIPEGLPAGSDVAILSIFGCDPHKCYTGRAPLEAAATGIKLSPGDAAYRCNMVTFEDGDMPFEEKKIVSHSAGSIEGQLSVELIEELLEMQEFKKAASDAGITVYPALSFRHIAVQKSCDITGLELTPPHDHLGETVGMHLPRGGKNAGVLEGLLRLAHKLLDKHPTNTKRRAEGKLPANGIWFWAEGTVAELPSFGSMYKKTGGVVSAVPLCRGIGALIGLHSVHVEGATGELNTNYEGKADAVFEILKENDFAAVHIEAPDECSHDGDLSGKIQAIEWIDSRIVAPITNRMRGAGIEYRMLVISDHRTLLSTRGHDDSPVPFLLYDSRVNKNTGLRFCEEDMAHGRVVASGTDLMGILFEDLL